MTDPASPLAGASGEPLGLPPPTAAPHPAASRGTGLFSHRSVQTALGGTLVALIPFGVRALSSWGFSADDRTALAGALGTALTTLVVALFRLNPSEKP